MLRWYPLNMLQIILQLFAVLLKTNSPILDLSLKNNDPFKTGIVLHFPISQARVLGLLL